MHAHRRAGLRRDEVLVNLPAMNGTMGAITRLNVVSTS
jgi:hypothetical protein